MAGQDTHADVALREAILGYADMVLAKADAYLSGEVHKDERERKVIDDRLRALRQIRNRLDLSFAQGIGIYNDDYHALRRSVDEQIRAIEGPPVKPERNIRGGIPE